MGRKLTSVQTCLRPVVPDIGRELPVASYLLPYDEILASDFLRRRFLHLEAERSDLLRRGGPERLDLECYEFRIADLLSRTFPHCLDRCSALHHASTRWERGCVFRVERCDAGEIAFVEEIHPFRIHRLDLGPLGERRRD